MLRQEYIEFLNHLSFDSNIDRLNLIKKLRYTFDLYLSDAKNIVDTYLEKKYLNKMDNEEKKVLTKKDEEVWIVRTYGFKDYKTSSEEEAMKFIKWITENNIFTYTDVSYIELYKKVNFNV